MKSIHFISSLMADGGGPSYTVPRLAEALATIGWESEIAALDAPAARTLGGVRVTAFKRDTAPMASLAKLGRSRAMARGVSALGGDVLHAHGLWMMPNVYPARVSQQTGRPLVLAPRGMLGADALKFSATAKHLFWNIWQKRAVAQVSCFHATAESELEDIRAFGLTAPVAVIPNGIHIPEGDPAPGARTILHLGRLHPKKGIDRLVAAWAQVAGRHPDWRLRIVGPSEIGCRAALERQVHDLGVPRVDFGDPLYGADKWAAYCSAGLFVLPTLNENFGMVVAEALASGVPAISTKGAPWQGLEAERCGWWVDHGPDAMAAALNAALSLPDTERVTMGARGRTWMARDFGWDGIAAQMAQVYAWCLGQSDRPDCVIA